MGTKSFGRRVYSGLLPTDDRMKIEGLDHVWAAGDATAFAVKQGGLAAQQAVLAARAIAASAGARVDVPPFKPVLRAALITGDTPDFMRAPVGEPDAGIASAGRSPSAWAALRRFMKPSWDSRPD